MISTAILAAVYAVCHPVFLPRTAAPSLDVSLVRVIAVEEAASALVSRVVEFRASSAGGVGVGAGICTFDLRRRGITKVDHQVNLIVGLTSGMIGSVTTALDTASRPDSTLSLRAEGCFFRVMKSLRGDSFGIGVRRELLPNHRRGWQIHDRARCK